VSPRELEAGEAGERLFDVAPYGNVTLLHITDPHGAARPVLYREPDRLIGVGPERGHPPYLAGDALLNFAFEMMLTPGESEISPDCRLKAAFAIAEASGARGMVAGQTIDMAGKKNLGRADLERMDSLKTGALLCAAGIAGCILVGASPEKVEAAKSYCVDLGLAFQIRDDMLDVIGDEKTLGKPIGSDSESGKVTYVDLLGLEGCKAEVGRLTDSAIRALGSFADKGILPWLALTLSGRTK
jgi:geranylgeranyl diphosphate synthase type II